MDNNNGDATNIERESEQPEKPDFAPKEGHDDSGDAAEAEAKQEEPTEAVEKEHVKTTEAVDEAEASEAAEEPKEPIEDTEADDEHTAETEQDSTPEEAAEESDISNQPAADEEQPPEETPAAPAEEVAAGHEEAERQTDEAEQDAEPDEAAVESNIIEQTEAEQLEDEPELPQDDETPDGEAEPELPQDDKIPDGDAEPDLSQEDETLDVDTEAEPSADSVAIDDTTADNTAIDSATTEDKTVDITTIAAADEAAPVAGPEVALEGRIQPELTAEGEQVISVAKPVYSMRAFGFVCIASELVWFFGSKWVMSMVRTLGLNPVSTQYIVAVLWFPLTMFIIPNIYMRIKKLDAEKFVGMGGKFKRIDMLTVGLAAFAVWALMRLPEMYWSRMITSIFGSDIPRISGVGAYDTIFIIDFIRKCIIPAFFEEYLYRGVLFRSLRGGIGARRAAALSSLIFMLMHTDLTNVVAPIALGLLCCYLLEVTGSIYPCMLSHFIYNTSSTIGNLGAGAREITTTFGAGLPIVLLMLLSCTVLLVMCMFMVRKGGRFEQSVSVEEYAVCKRSRFDLLPYYLICIFLVAGYFI